MTVAPFRNVDLGADQPVSDWPGEAIETAIDRGTLADWRVLAAEIRRSPWGPVARTVLDVAGWGEHDGIDRLFSEVVRVARDDVVGPGRRRWADVVRRLRSETGLSMREFASLAGTSASRLSDYENARVAPTTDALARLEHAAHVATDRRPIDG